MTQTINAVAYGDDQITWVHIIHVGGPGKNHINDWFEGNGTQGQKRIAAQDAVSQALGQPIVSVTNAKRKENPKPQQVTEANRGTTKKRATNGAGKPIPINTTRDAILARISARGDIEPHPSQARRHGTKYISAFSCECGVIFAVDKMSASKQPIWFLDNTRLRSALDSAGTAYDLYPPESGRNSNLYKLYQFALIKTHTPIHGCRWT